MTERTGRCLCGAVSFELAAEPLATRVCWCRDCQHLAANGSVNLLVSADALTISGTLSEYTKTADSGNVVTRQFCPACGAHLFARSSARPQFRVVRAGNLDEPSSIHPDMNIWAESAPNWACLDPTLERVEQQPVPPKPSPASDQQT
ncbi:Glutathione-dependent formaldehyde-activating GFA [Candidatus Propionivibrio aalborgensis]|uniref:Glutathione-dependent formaldehyde-activating GFA n=1 Tax=Candidatus Propionivibrio aalborgensis TaxID=1860101 RepID=A0A1A8XS34_9RHOO|nr:GFA family protein [Candidatus Propionivibrio aalborgensis]SBT07297.1 Glutathione-dependent formaldehyde-activating GFA [Candidatus Propionivibrio aalborgensis]